MSEGPEKSQTNHIWPFVGLGFDAAVVAWLLSTMDIREPFVAGLVGGCACFGLLVLVYALHRRRISD
jgi:hypothetical protein